MSLGIKEYLKQLGFTMLWIFSIICFITVLIGVPMKVHLDGKISEYSAMTQILERTPLTEVGYLVNKLQIIQYNAWLAYWQHLEQYPIIELFIPDKIDELKPIKLVPWVSYSVPGTTMNSIKKTTKKQIDQSKEIAIIIKGKEITIEELKIKE